MEMDGKNERDQWQPLTGEGMIHHGVKKQEDITMDIWNEVNIESRKYWKENKVLKKRIENLNSALELWIAHAKDKDGLLISTMKSKENKVMGLNRGLERLRSQNKKLELQLRQERTLGQTKIHSNFDIARVKGLKTSYLCVNLFAPLTDNSIFQDKVFTSKLVDRVQGYIDLFHEKRSENRNYDLISESMIDECLLDQYKAVDVVERKTLKDQEKDLGEMVNKLLQRLRAHQEAYTLKQELYRVSKSQAQQTIERLQHEYKINLDDKKKVKELEFVLDATKNAAKEMEKSHEMQLMSLQSELKDLQDKFRGVTIDSSVLKERMTYYQRIAEKSQVEGATKEAPTGKIAIVFTDIQDSSSLWYQDHATMEECVDLHNILFRNNIHEYNGYEVKTEGDAFMIAFSTVQDAVKFSLQTQLKLLEIKWPSKLYETQEAVASIEEVHDDQGTIIFKGLRVRIGIHVGSPICKIDPVTNRYDYFGTVINRGARVSSQAKGGQILLSNDAWNEVKDEISATALGIPCWTKRIGTARLRGMEEKPDVLWLILPSSLKKRESPQKQIKEIPLVSKYRKLYEKHQKRNVKLKDELNRLKTQYEKQTQRSQDEIGKLRNELNTVNSRLKRYSSNFKRNKLEAQQLRSNLKKLKHNLNNERSKFVTLKHRKNQDELHKSKLKNHHSKQHRMKEKSIEQSKNNGLISTNATEEDATKKKSLSNLLLQQNELLKQLKTPKKSATISDAIISVGNSEEDEVDILHFNQNLLSKLDKKKPLEESLSSGSSAATSTVSDAKNEEKESRSLLTRQDSTDSNFDMFTNIFDPLMRSINGDLKKKSKSRDLKKRNTPVVSDYKTIFNMTDSSKVLQQYGKLKNLYQNSENKTKDFETKFRLVNEIVTSISRPGSPYTEDNLVNAEDTLGNSNEDNDGSTTSVPNFSPNPKALSVETSFSSPASSKSPTPRDEKQQLQVANALMTPLKVRKRSNSSPLWDKEKAKMLHQELEELRSLVSHLPKKEQDLYPPVNPLNMQTKSPKLDSIKPVGENRSLESGTKLCPTLSASISSAEMGSLYYKFLKNTDQNEKCIQTEMDDPISLENQQLKEEIQILMKKFQHQKVETTDLRKDVQILQNRLDNTHIQLELFKRDREMKKEISSRANREMMFLSKSDQRAIIQELKDKKDRIHIQNFNKSYQEMKSEYRKSVSLGGKNKTPLEKEIEIRVPNISTVMYIDKSVPTPATPEFIHFVQKAPGTANLMAKRRSIAFEGSDATQVL